RVAPLDLAGVVAGGDQVGDRDAPLAAAGLVGVGQLAGAEAALDRGAGNRAALRRFREGPGGSVHASTVSPRRARALAASCYAAESLIPPRASPTSRHFNPDSRRRSASSWGQCVSPRYASRGWAISRCAVRSETPSRSASSRAVCLRLTGFTAPTGQPPGVVLRTACAAF